MIINSATLSQFFIAMSAAFKNGFDTAESQYEQIAMTVPSSTSANAYPWLGALPSMREWIGDRVIGNLKTHKYTIENKGFETTVSVARNDIEDDQLGIYTPMFADLGAQAKIHANRLVFGALQQGHEMPCYDGQYFFDADHPVCDKSVSNSLGDDSAAPWYLLCTKRPVKPVIFQKRREYILTALDAISDINVFMRGEYVYGVDARVNVGYGLWQCAVRSTSALDADSYAAARAAMRGFTNDNGDPLGIVPDLLVVPSTHEAAGLRLVKNQLAAGGGNNEWYNSAELLVSPWLV